MECGREKSRAETESAVHSGGTERFIWDTSHNDIIAKPGG